MATPLLNRVQDIQVYLNLMWRSSWPFGLNKSDPTQAETWYEDALMGQIRTKGHYKGIRPLRLKSNPDNDLDVQAAAPGKDASNDDPALALADAIARRECEEYEEMVDRLDEPIFLLHSGLFDAYGNSKKFSAIVAQHAIRPIMRMMAIWRGMLTLTKLPDGTLVSPGADIPPIDIRTVELSHANPFDAEQVRRVIFENIGRLQSSVPPAPAQHLYGDNTQLSSCRQT